MSAPRETVLIRIVDDEEVRNALSFMLACKGWSTECHASAAEFLKTIAQPRRGASFSTSACPGCRGLSFRRA